MSKAVQLIAEGRMSANTIARTLGISSTQLNKWRARPEFKTQLKTTLEEIREACEATISDKRSRIAVLQDLHDRLLQVISERSVQAVATASVVPGAETGLIVTELRGVGFGENFQLVEEYRVDLGLIKEVRAIHIQVAKELGQEGVENDGTSQLDTLISQMDEVSARMEEDAKNKIN